MSTTETETAEAPALQIKLLPRPGKDRDEFERTGIMAAQAEDSVLELTWCLNHQASERVKTEMLNIYLLIVVSNDGREVSRHVVPFDAGYHYAMFYRSGLNKVHVAAVWDGYERVKSVLLKRNDDGEYRAEVLEEYHPGEQDIQRQIDAVEVQIRTLSGVRHQPDVEELDALYNEQHRLYVDLEKLRATAPSEIRIPDFDSLNQFDHGVVEEVNVSPTMFAKNLAITRWLSKVWPYFRKRPASDACETRKRAYLYTLPWIWAYGLYLMAKEIGSLASIAGLLFLGVRGINFRPLWRPWSTVPADTSRGTDTWFWLDNPDGTVRKTPIFVFSPLVLLGSYIVATITVGFWSQVFPDATEGPHFVHAWTIWWFHLLVVLTPAAIVVGIGAILLLFHVLGLVSETSPAKSLRRRLQAAQEEREREAEQEYVKRVEALTCDNGNALLSPRKKRPIFLSPKEMKGRYCKPHQR